MLQMRFVSNSLALGIPKTDIGLNVVSGTYIQFDIDGDISTYGIATAFTGGKEGKTIIFGHIDTNWFDVNPTYRKKLGGIRNRLAELAITGLVPGYGSADMKFTVFDDYNAPWLTIERVSEPVRGVLIHDMKVRNRLVMLPKKSPSQQKALAR